MLGMCLLMPWRGVSGAALAGTLVGTLAGLPFERTPGFGAGGTGGGSELRADRYSAQSGETGTSAAMPVRAGRTLMPCAALAT